MARIPGSGRSDTNHAVALTQAGLHVLIALLDGQLHGYGIMQRILDHTDGRLRVGPGTLYRTIQRLLDDHLIVESHSRPRPDLDDPRRRYYSLTERGRSVLDEEAAHMEKFVRLARNKHIRLALAGLHT